jgi:hypothetical protein
MWFDAELPILLRFVADPPGRPSEVFAEVTDLRIGSVGSYPIEHGLLNKRLDVLDDVPADAGEMLRRIRSAVPDVRTLQLRSWDGQGGFAKRLGPLLSGA